ncbi:MAG: GNAT family N-acetyltransferase [Alphaproteobacteria bacterium]|nr:GNAT family N-acetyltransferase [Alphaproteobacteria bacterium]
MSFDTTFTLNPKSQDIDFLTQKINEDAQKNGIQEKAYSFAFFMRGAKDNIIAGCNGSVIYGSIYTDQLWVHEAYRNQGLGTTLMQQVHDYGREIGCSMASIATMSFQKASKFYENLGYVCDFERIGYSNGASCVFMKKILQK